MSRQGFPRQLRLLTAGDYRRVFDQAAFKVHGKGLLALACNNDLGHPRVGLVFSKKNVRRAVDRNHLKRLVRESFRLQQHRLPAVDIVVLSRRGVRELDSDTLHRQLYGMWRRLEKDVRKQSANTT
ncbi:ribonuclease P protein component [Litchfieldella anticariensis]|uniref:ribonuclease P protein component n=1 Tax=Litchfieldella anticariensis TaxID=258591 RepID=UPI0003991DBC|nr:ribonuclease P protein component [Halomonas anticariensis]